MGVVVNCGVAEHGVLKPILRGSRSDPSQTRGFCAESNSHSASCGYLILPRRREKLVERMGNARA